VGHRRVAAGGLAEVAQAAARGLQTAHPAPTLVFDAAGRQVDLDLRGTPEDTAARAVDARAQDAWATAPATTPTTTFAPATHSPEPTGDRTEVSRIRRRPPTPAAAPRSRGRPQLGVVAREVTLLPRHWEWLATQSGGASAALRRLVEAARREADPRDAARKAQERTYRFLTAIAGDLPRYEDALRALFAGQAPAFEAALAGWPHDIATHATLLARGAFETAT
jgi:hypothetical protein